MQMIIKHYTCKWHIFFAGLLVFCPEHRPMNPSCMPWEDRLPHNLKVLSPS